MNEPFIQETERVLSIKKWQRKIPGLIAGFTTRNGGVSKAPFDSLNIGLHVHDEKQHVLTNRKRLVADLSFSMNDWVSGEQVHKTNIKRLEEESKGSGAVSNADSIPNTDGLITNREGILCTAFFADCVPLFFLDPITGYIGIAHAGWRGTVQKIAEEMVLRFSELGTNKNDLLVAIGPSISMEKCEVDDEVINNIEQKFLNKTTKKIAEDKYLLDLKQLNVEILLQSGVLSNNIDVTDYCTYKDNDFFYSFRRDYGKTGRMLGF